MIQNKKEYFVTRIIVSIFLLCVCLFFTYVYPLLIPEKLIIVGLKKAEFLFQFFSIVGGCIGTYITFFGLINLLFSERKPEKDPDE